MTDLKPSAHLIRFGIIGCARIARKLVGAISVAPNAEVVAVGSRSADKSRQFIVETGLSGEGVRAYGSYDEVLNDPRVDVVYVPLPTSLHVQWATAAAAHGKHLLLEKPTALCAADLDVILEACEANGVQFMDSTMWMHHPRTAAMSALLLDRDRFGEVTTVQSMFGFTGDENFLKNDIRVKPDLDALGALGDVGWYCIRGILWSVDYELPSTVTAVDAVKNEHGVLLSCGASLNWKSGKVATFHCSFRTNLTMNLHIIGTKGCIEVTDFVIPYECKSAEFRSTSNAQFNKQHTGWNSLPNTHVVKTEVQQEVTMVIELSRLVQGIKDGVGKPDNKWPLITRKTQVVMDAVHASIENGFQTVNVTV